MRKKIYTRLTIVFATLFAFTLFVTAQTTLEIQVGASLDDVEEVAVSLEADAPVGSVDGGSSDLELIFDHEPQYVGMLFRSVAIPVGAGITNAYVQFQVDAIKEGVTDATLTLEVYGGKEANAADLSETDNTVSSHPKTTAVVPWSPGPSVAEGDKGANEQTPDISAVVQEIIETPGWASGNNMLIVVAPDAAMMAQTEDANREMESFDGDPTGAPTLSVTYVEGTGISTTKEFTYAVYPNPTQGQVYISNPSNENFSYEIFNINGQLVASRYNLSGTSTELDMSSFAKGMYFVDVTSSDRVETHKLILK